MANVFPATRFLLAGPSKAMNVNGSTTPVDYYIAPPPNQVWEFFSFNLVIASLGTISQITQGFYTLPALAKGIDFEYRKSGVFSTNLGYIKTNADLLNLFNTSFPVTKVIGNFNHSVGSVDFAPTLILNGLTGDYLRVRINDNLSTFEMMTMALHGSVITNP